MYEIRHLRIHDFKNIDVSTNLTKLELRSEKEQVDFATFLTKEATKAVNDYLEYRGRTSKTARQEALEKQAVIDDSGYLFIKKNIPDKWLETHDEELRHISTESFVRIYRDIASKCKKLAPKGKMNLIRSHNMRRYFYSALLNAECDNVFIEFFMGHKLDKTRAGYSRFYVKKIAIIYEKYIAELTIMPEPDEEILKRYVEKLKSHEELEAENKQL